MSSTDSSSSQKLDAFRLESLDAFDWNHWMTSIGISGCFRLELVDGLPRNTHIHELEEEKEALHSNHSHAKKYAARS
jgi:hypothetical protein